METDILQTDRSKVHQIYHEGSLEVRKNLEYLFTKEELKSDITLRIKSIKGVLKELYIKPEYFQELEKTLPEDLFNYYLLTIIASAFNTNNPPNDPFIRYYIAYNKGTQKMEVRAQGEVSSRSTQITFNQRHYAEAALESFRYVYFQYLA